MNRAVEHDISLLTGTAGVMYHNACVTLLSVGWSHATIRTMRLLGLTAQQASPLALGAQFFQLGSPVGCRSCTLQMKLEFIADPFGGFALEELWHSSAEYHGLCQFGLTLQSMTHLRGSLWLCRGPARGMQCPQRITL